MDKIRDRLWTKAAQNKIPLTGAFELLPVCNLSCKMCYVRKSMKEVNESGGLISGKRWLEFARSAYEQGMLFPLLTGGEPFLHPDFKEILVGMQNMGMQVSINSNATMIDEDMVKWLTKHTPTRINITIYGASEESYQKLCGNGDAFNKMKNAVLLLKQYGIPVKFNTSITAENIDDLEEIIKFAHELEIPIQVASYMFPPIRRDKNMIGQNHRLTPKQAGYVKAKADFLQADTAWFLGQAENYRRFIDPSTIDFQNISRKEMRMSCRAGASSMWIDWQGNLANCGMYSSSKVSLKETPLKEAWKKIVLETQNMRYKPVCSGCPNVRICHPCIAMVNNESGFSDGKPDYICEMNYAASKYYQDFLKEIKEDEIENVERIINQQHCDIDQF